MSIGVKRREFNLDETNNQSLSNNLYNEDSIASSIVKIGSGGGSLGISKPISLNNIQPIPGITKPSPPSQDISTIARPEVEMGSIESDEIFVSSNDVIGISSLPYVQNPYPYNVGTDPSSKYSSKDNEIKFTGKFSENFLKFDVKPIDDILALDINEYPTSFNFIIEFLDNGNREYWSSPDLVAQLRAEIKAGNPYTNRNTIPVVKFDFGFIKGYSSSEQFKISEDYAEVNITKTITTKEDVLKHINWLVSSDSSLRPANQMGSWEIELTEQLGMDHSKQLSQLQSMLINEEPNISTGTGDSTGEIINDNATTNTAFQLYAPFGEPGRRNKERRKDGGTTYRWKKNPGIWIRIET
jgi:hypothetical protein